MGTNVCPLHSRKKRVKLAITIANTLSFKQTFSYSTFKIFFNYLGHIIKAALWPFFSICPSLMILTVSSDGATNSPKTWNQPKLGYH